MVVNDTATAETAIVYDTTGHMLTCTTTAVNYTLGYQGDVVFGWAAVLVLGTFLWVYIVTRKRPRGGRGVRV